MMRWLLLALLLLLAAPAWAQTFPPLTGRVVDQANLLDPAQEAGISSKAEALEKASGRQFVVATVDSLEGRDIQNYGYRLGRHWGIGTEEKNDGVLLLVAPNERKVRIEVGYGLEPILTDALSSVIINRAILPKFRDGDMAGGIVAGADAVITQISLPADEAAKRQQELLAAEKDKGDGDVPIALIFWIIVIMFIVIPMFFGGRRGRKYRRGHGPIVIWGPGDWGGGSGGGSWGGGSGGGSWGGGGGSFGGGGASGDW
ncbi:YgcG family protein [Sphingomonas sp. LaA6.9]|uniref:TPM domain-containing protein n=1 Tax=Sphingomonas sp. LaA6.9 TaxID=2919914 RepID=UPI001F500417|nr:TPM domain-containing protein [Sphingomonas sp. LaA6.9]MCJ8157974.1 TPM domain-containing protein [Sphingomonas sp. LaA6.9]